MHFRKGWEGMENLTEKFVKEIERRILTGQWEVGMKLPSTRALAEEFYVSRSVISVGIAQLCRNGYLQTVPRGYVYVSDWKKTGNFSLVDSLLDSDLCNAQIIENLLEGRMTLEKAIVKKAATTHMDEDLEHLRLVIEDEQQCTTAEEKALADEAFHHAIVSASHNIVYTAMFNSFSTVIERLTRQFYHHDVDHDYVIRMHQKIYEAIKESNPALAEECMELLLAHGEAELKRIGL